MAKTVSASALRELERGAKHRLAVLRHVGEISGNIAATCRCYGISRQAYYGWLKRYEAEGVDGLRDRSSAPHYSPNATHAEVVEKILWLRQQYHFGPQKIAMCLKRYHDLTISSSRVWRILHKAAWVVCRRRSVTNATTPSGSVTRNNAPATPSRST
jgi:transposase